MKDQFTRPQFMGHVELWLRQSTILINGRLEKWPSSRVEAQTRMRIKRLMMPGAENRISTRQPPQSVQCWVGLGPVRTPPTSQHSYQWKTPTGFRYLSEPASPAGNLGWPVGGLPLTNRGEFCHRQWPTTQWSSIRSTSSATNLTATYPNGRLKTNSTSSVWPSALRGWRLNTGSSISTASATWLKPISKKKSNHWNRFFWSVFFFG